MKDYEFVGLVDWCLEGIETLWLKIGRYPKL